MQTEVAERDGQVKRRSKPNMATLYWTKAQPRAYPRMKYVCMSMDEAARKVMANKGSAGVDGMTVDELLPLLEKYGSSINQKLENGAYIPCPVRRKDIPKPNGKKRMLGIPTVLDRTIQQALVIVLQDDFEPQFSDNSYGFRPGRSANQAVSQAKQYVKDGYRWVVEIDLESFFDRVNHDKLMGIIAKVIDDKTVLKLIRRYLNAGIMENGLVKPRTEGVPQGGPLSPLLSNIMLTELDRELEKRGLHFCRYADDCNIYVRSKTAAERVLRHITRFIEEELKLRVNRDKSGTFRPCDSVYLGYTFSRVNYARVIAAKKAVDRLKDKLRKVFFSARGTSLKCTIERITPILRGWRNYYRQDSRKKFYEEMDEWIRHHLRALIWLAWKKPKTRYKNLRKRLHDEERAKASAGNGRGAWWNAHAKHMHDAYPNATFSRLGLYQLAS